MSRIIAIVVLLGLTLAMLVSCSRDEQLRSNSGAAAADGSVRQLSIYGVGSATAPAEALRLQFVIEHWDDYGPGRSRTATERLQPMIDAALSAGLDESQISVPTFLGHYGTQRMHMSLDNPDQEQVQALFSELVEVSSVEGLHLVHIGGFFEYDDCSTLETESFTAAVDDARERAERLALTLNTSIVDIIDVSEQPGAAHIGNQQASSCSTVANSGPSDFYSEMLTRGYSTFDPDQELAIQVDRIVHVTYTIE